MKILVLNCGSSSLKYQLIDMETEKVMASGKYERIGEKGPLSRKAICDQLEFFGVKLDDEKNKIRGEEAEISSSDSKVKVYVVPTNEELMIAKETQRLLQNL